MLPVTLPAPNSAHSRPARRLGPRDRDRDHAPPCCSGRARRPRRPAPRRRSALRAAADLADAPAAEAKSGARRARKAVDELGRRFLGHPAPADRAGRATVALASIPEELDWLLTFLGPSATTPSLELACAEDKAAVEAVAAVLRASAERLEGADDRPDFARLDEARDAVARALTRRLPELPAVTDDALLDGARGAVPDPGGELLGPPACRLRASRHRQEWVRARETTRSARLRHGRRSSATEQLAIEHVSAESVWFQNSLRGAAGLAIAVYIAQRSGLQHGFWVVLGTLSVLRSNALGTGWSILSALAGTAVGLVAGALLVIAIGTHDAVLWAVLPFAILFATYAPRAISFAAGQAAFTVVLFVLFNIIQPVGWRVGLVRVEDVSIGFAISLGVGLLFWPRGAGARLREDLAAAYARAADLVVATARQLTESDDPDASARAARLADAAVHRLDDAFRQFLTERSASRLNLDEVAAFVGGAARVRRAAQSLGALVEMAGADRRLAQCGSNLERELHALQSWYVALGYAIVNARPVPPPTHPGRRRPRRLIACVRQAAASPDPATAQEAAVLLWTSQHLDNLWRLEAQLAERAVLARETAQQALTALTA